MRILIILGLLLGLTANDALSQIDTETFTVSNGTIPDGTAVGAAFYGTVNDIAVNIANITVSLGMSGGYNGDLYAYIVAPDNHTRVQLMNQPGPTGFGAPGAGFTNFTLDDSAPDNIQTAVEAMGVPFSGNYQADGTLANINGQIANGTWTLFIADLVSGGGSGPSVLNSWSLNITPVPEPSSMMLGMLGLVLGATFTRFRQID